MPQPERKPGSLIHEPDGDGRYSSNGEYVYVCDCGRGTRTVTVSGRDDDWIGYSADSYGTTIELLDCPYCRQDTSEEVISCRRSH